MNIDTAATPLQLIETLAGTGVSVSNVTSNCPPGAFGKFSNGQTTNIGLSQGILLTTGRAMLALGPNTLGATGFEHYTPGDPSLNAIAGATTFDACAIEFDIIPICDTLRFEYVFASEEYPEWVNLGYNDAFAFFISGPGITGTVNIALVPGTSLPVTIDNINVNFNPQYYVDNFNGPTIEYDAFTTPLAAEIIVSACQTYHVKLVIADGGDEIYDSGVFLSKGTLRCYGIEIASSAENAVEGCNFGVFQVCHSGDTLVDQVVYFQLGGTAVNGVDYIYVPDSVVIPAGQYCTFIAIAPIADGLSEPIETVLLRFRPTPCAPFDTSIVYIMDELTVDAGANVTFCSNGSADLGNPPLSGFTYSWSPTVGISDSTISNPSVTLINTSASPMTITYYLAATADSCTVFDSVRVTVNPYPIANAGIDNSICSENTTSIGANSTAGYTYLWSPVNGLSNSTVSNPSVTLTNSGITPTTHSYSVLTTVFNCSLSDEIIITVNPVPLPDAGRDTIYCSGDTVSIGVSLIPGYSYSWSLPDGLSSTTVSSPLVFLTNHVEAHKTVQYVLTTTFFGCEAKDSVSITVKSTPEAKIEAIDSMCVNRIVTVQHTGTAFSNLIYKWDFGVSDILGGTAAGPYQIIYRTPGNPVISLFVTADGCVSETDSISVRIKDCTILNPNVFSPDGNSINDYFIIPNLDEYPGHKLTVFNRWGKVVFETLDYKNDWDGKDNPAGVYYYILQLQEGTVFHGHVTIIK